MAQVVISNSLEKEINKKFKANSVDIFSLIFSLKKSPKKGKAVDHIGPTVIKELKYGSYRFYFITEGHKIKFLKIEELTDLIIRFVAMSDKKSQQKVIGDIKRVLKEFGEKGFSDD